MSEMSEMSKMGIDELLQMGILDRDGEENTVGGVIDELTPADKLELIDRINPSISRDELIESIMNTDYIKSDIEADPKNEDSNRVWLESCSDDKLIQKFVEYSE